MRKQIAAAMIAATIILSSSNAAWADKGNEAKTEQIGNEAGDTAIAGAAVDTTLANQWKAGFERSYRNPQWVVQRGYAFEEMATKAQNFRQPWNRIKLEENPQAEGIDARYLRSGRAIQMKATDSEATPDIIRKALDKLDEMGETDGEVWIPKGVKAKLPPDLRNNPRIKESPISKKKLEEASKAKSLAETTPEMLGKAGIAGAVIGGGIETLFKGYELNQKRIRGEKISWEDWKNAAMAIATEASYGAVSGVAGAVGAAACISTGVATPVAWLCGAAAGGAANIAARLTVKGIKSIF